MHMAETLSDRESKRDRDRQTEKERGEKRDYTATFTNWTGPQVDPLRNKSQNMFMSPTQCRPFVDDFSRSRLHRREAGLFPQVVQRHTHTGGLLSEIESREV